MARAAAKWMAAGLVLALAGAEISAQSQRAAELVKVQLLADVEAVQPGKPFRVGVLLKMAPSWHVYWRNPGDSGQAVSVAFEVPAGFTVSDVAFPVPKKFVQPGDLVAYGYADEVMLIATVTPPKDLASAADVAMSAKVKYLVCDENACLPGKGDGAVRLPVSADARPANTELFEAWGGRIPLASDDARKVADVKVDGKLEQGSGNYVIDLAWKDDASGVEFFPGKSGTVSVSDIEVKSDGPQRSRITFDARVLAGQQPDVRALDSVVAYTDGSGRRRGIEVVVPVAGAR